MRRRHRRIHRVAWTVLAVLLPLVLLGALAGRRTGPLEAASVLIAPPP
jgi:hypothetical protein